jgi:succinate-semialdehyde dehydrogenase/glutarate-semialdehyde dehydrogenase
MSDKLISSIPTNLYIGGQWVPSSDGNRIPIVDPATEQVIADVASGSADDATSAVDAAFSAAAEWAATPPRVRAEVLRKAFELMTSRREELATIISREEGKTLAEGLGEVAYAAEFFTTFWSTTARLVYRF